MATATLDTFQIVKNLRAAGMPEEQATAGMTALRDAREFDLSTLALKSDLREVELRLEAKIEGVKSEILKWMFEQTIAIVAAVVGLLKFLH
ncbi:hypothetical protein ADL19_05555 [Streptomyces purpurogeneiscleroticus]|nr:hypothetical protein ADL19_05555 [Streptomyces purpurogeneiscleroticus]